MRNLWRIAFVRCVKKSFSIIIATFGVAWFLDLFHYLKKEKKNRFTNSNFGEDLQVSLCF